MTCAVPDHVDGVILFPSGEPAVALDAHRIDIEAVECLLIVEGVQVDADPVVRPGVVSARDRGFDLAGLAIVTAEGEVQVLAIVRDECHR